MNKKLIQKKIMYPFLLIIILLSISITPVHAASVQNDNVKLRMVILPYLSFAPFFIAQEEGFFQEQGLDVEFVKLSEGLEALPLLIQGKLDVATGTIGINIMNAIARGGTVKIVADKGHINPKGCPVNGILIRRGLINDSSDIVDQLRGKKISLNPISTDGYYVEKAFNKIGLTMDDDGIPRNAEKRLEIARLIVNSAEQMGIPREDVIIDPLAMAISADDRAGLETIKALRLIRDELGVNMTLGLSNISFGLPERTSINAVFLAMAVLSGLTCAISDPTVWEMKRAILLTDLLLGKDEFCMNYLSASGKSWEKLTK